jgi:uncharacterized protein (TIGR02117 family)
MNVKKIFKAIAWAITGFLAFVVLYFLAAYILSHISTTKEADQSADVTIYLSTNGVHTDIVVPVKRPQIDWSKEIKFSNTISKDTTAAYLGLGWGDKGFYLNTPTWSQLKFSVAFRAATGLSTAAMHTTFHQTMVESATCKRIMISKAQYARLIIYVQNSFKTDPAGHIINIKTNANYDKEDAFYEAYRRYNLFYTCNTWANNALKAAGQKACVWTPFDKGIFYIYR